MKPAIAPEESYQTLLTKHSEQLEALRAIFHEDDFWTDIDFYRYLLASKFCLDTTIARIKSTQEFLSLEDLSQSLHTTVSPHKDLVSNYYTFDNCIGFSNDGSPVSLERTGRLDPQGLHENVSDQNLKEYLLHNMMSHRLALNRLSDSQQRVVRQYHIMDLEGLGTHHAHSQFIGLFKQSSELSQLHFPEQLEKVVLVNVPWAFKVVWAFIKPFVDSKTQGKMVILGKDYEKELGEILGKELVERVGRDRSSEWNELALQGKVKEVRVKARSSFCEVVEPRGRQSISFYFGVQSQDITLRVYRTSVSSSEDEEEVEQRCLEFSKKLVAGSVFHGNVQDSSYSFELDNTCSYLSGKTVQYAIL